MPKIYLDLYWMLTLRLFILLIYSTNRYPDLTAKGQVIEFLDAIIFILYLSFILTCVCTYNYFNRSAPLDFLPAISMKEPHAFKRLATLG
jgi:hypothetical protein